MRELVRSYIPANKHLPGKLIICVFTVIWLDSVFAAKLPTFEELAVIRAKAHQDRFKQYVLDKLEVYSAVQNQRGMCLDFIGDSDGLYRSWLNSGPIMVDLADCGKEHKLIDGRVRALRLLDPKERQQGLTVDQIDQVIEEINALFADKVYDPDIEQ